MQFYPSVMPVCEERLFFHGKCGDVTMCLCSQICCFFFFSMLPRFLFVSGLYLLALAFTKMVLFTQFYHLLSKITYHICPTGKTAYITNSAWMKYAEWTKGTEHRWTKSRCCKKWGCRQQHQQHQAHALCTAHRAELVFLFFLQKRHHLPFRNAPWFWQNFFLFEFLNHNAF